ncbi:hypothetical protein ABPG77_004691 [Micractinium sp. CCAP 211/92]
MLAARRVVSEEGFAMLKALRKTLATGSRRPRSATSNPAAPPAAASTAPPPAQQQQQSNAQLVAKGDEWTEVVHQPTGLTYYWNQRTNETTALGEPKPRPEGRLAAYRRATMQPGQALPRTAGLGQLMAMGAGIGLVFALLARLL